MSSLLFILEFVFGALEAFATLLLSITIFRIPFRSVYFRLLLLGFIISGISLLFYNVWNLPFYFGEMVNHSLTILFFFLFVYLKLWESFMVTIVGYLSASLVQGVAYYFLSTVGIIEGNLVSTSLESFTSLMTLQFIYAIIIFHLSIIFYRYRLGFLISTDTHSSKNDSHTKSIKISIIISITLLLAFFVGHFVVMNKLDSIQSWIILIYLGAALLSLVFIYLLNREHLEDEYENLKNHFH
ncbi:hypothetical protein SAMN05421676_102387 [Salinibacillus kushneri]|uniref:Uncharacterized protein n=1 Tax=Salinibacillus kushneri TaxID=237682 RepID=A0A1I0BB62_9BACI|nr:hypothetical protein [Salinibacillus kushneri]SET03340.1 hypothetical protein SAMN05421676_102387 [Salinibacillus kushneri]